MLTGALLGRLLGFAGSNVLPAFTYTSNQVAGIDRDESPASYRGIH